MESLMISISGVRGIVGGGFTPEVVSRFAAAFGTFVGGGAVVIGRDSRPSGQCIHLAAVSGLLSAGCDALDCGICPTPTVQVLAQGRAGGLAVTASHNPLEWNGLKFVGPDGLFLDERQMGALSTMYEKRAIDYVRWDKVGGVTSLGDASLGDASLGDALDRHIETILQLGCIHPDAIGRTGFTVAIDCCNGAVSEVGPRLLRRLGCEVVELYCQPTGLFPHDPEPIPANLGDLCSAVAAGHADVGFAADPDGDRLSVVSDKGEALGEEYTLALATKFVLSKVKGPVVVNLSTSKMIDDIAREAGVPVLRTPVGEVNVAKRMREVGSVVGGEGNGGVILPEAHYGRDALVGMALLLQALTESGAPISELARALPKYHIVKRTCELNGVDPVALMGVVADHYAQQSPDLTDGVKIAWPDRWVHIRRSNTEPTVRVIAEAPGEQEATDLCDETLRTIEKLMAGPVCEKTRRRP